VGEGVCGRFWGVDDGVRGRAGALVGIPVFCSKFIGSVSDRDGVAAVGANDSARLVLLWSGICGFVGGLWGGIWGHGGGRGGGRGQVAYGLENI